MILEISVILIEIIVIVLIIVSTLAMLYETDSDLFYSLFDKFIKRRSDKR